MSTPTVSPTPLSLDGIRVIDLSRVLAGPFCGALLGDLGADVIKVEDPGVGDESRTWPPHKDGESAGYLVNNRNKRGIAVNLKEPDGVAIVRRLVANADVLIENFRTGTMEEFGLGYDALSRDNPRLVYCSVSAFGRTGPRAEGAGYEALMQAFSGIMSITGEPGGAPVRCGVSFLDLTTGILCAFGVMSALRLRDRTGRGQRVDGSLLETALGLLNFQAEGFLLAGTVPRAARRTPRSRPIGTSAVATGNGSSSRAPTTDCGGVSRRRWVSPTWPTIRGTRRTSSASSTARSSNSASATRSPRTTAKRS